VGVSRDCPNFLGTPYYLRNGKSYGFQVWPLHSGGPSEQKTIRNFREKGAWAYPGTAQFFSVPPIISGTGKATNFKFCMYIYRLNRNKSPLKILRKVAILPNIFRTPIRRAHRAVIFATAQLSCCCYVDRFLLDLDFWATISAPCAWLSCSNLYCTLLILVYSF